ncbi:helix-turn-helix domain-containing protein [Chondrinema litorale]|uniref:helix-turn-helix domain-containing protein n=1 Tax=Chondrinema litorale TaxID=2994555 RepID=UPI003D6DE58A
MEKEERQKILQAEEEKLLQQSQQKKPSQPSRYALIFKEVKTLFSQGMGKKTIAKKLSISKNTVKRYLQFEEYPEKSLPTVKSNSARNYYNELKYHWSCGEKSPTKLWKLLVEQGIQVTYRSVHSIVNQFGEKEKKSAKTVVINWSSRKVSRLLLSYQKEMKAKEYKYIKALCQIQPNIQLARSLSIQFRNILAKRKGELLLKWIDACKQSDIAIMKRFGKSINRYPPHQVALAKNKRIY